MPAQFDPFGEPSEDGKWFSISLKASGAKGGQADQANIDIYDSIGMWGVKVKDLAEQISNLKVDTIHVRLNSPGGDAFGGIAIYNRLKDHSAKVVCTVDGVAASAASVIAMAADELVMNEGAQLMIHDAWSFAMGNAAAMRKAADRLDKLSSEVASIYAGRAGGDVAFWRMAMADETWYTGDEAVTAGLADSVNKKKKADAGVKNWNLGRVYCYAGRDAAPAPKLDKENQMPKFTIGDAELATDEDVQAALVELHALRSAEKPQPPVLTINGVETTDMSLVQAHIVSLEQLSAESKKKARRDFIAKLADNKKILASQVDALTKFALDLDEESFAAYVKTFEGVGELPTLAVGATVTEGSGAGKPPAADDAEAKAIKMHKGVVSQFRKMNMDEAALKETESYKFLVAHNAL